MDSIIPNTSVLFFFLYTGSLIGLIIIGSLWLFLVRKSKLAASENVRFFTLLTAIAAIFIFSFFVTSNHAWRISGAGMRDLLMLIIVPQILARVARSQKGFLFVLSLIGIALWAGLSTMRWSSGPGAALSPQHENEWELLIELDEGPGSKALQRSIQKYQLLVEPAFELRNKSNLSNFYAVEIPSHWEHLEEIILAELLENQAVVYAEYNEVLQLDLSPSSPPSNSDHPYRLNDPEIGRQWGFQAMQLDRLFDLLDKQGKPVKQPLIAILDTGIDGTHEDLAGNYRSTRTAYDSDQQGHGTHCAGIAAAVSNNSIGIASLFPSEGMVQVTSIRVLNDFGMGTQRKIIQGMLEAADIGADVISLSLGGKSKDARQRAYREAVEYCNRAGAIVVVAAGNDNGQALDIAPAKVPGVIVVSAVDTVLNRASFSNRVNGIEMALAAPGVAIYSTLPNNRYASQSGTSMATPQVAGLIALLKAFQPNLDTQTAFDILQNSGLSSNHPEETGPLIHPGQSLEELLARMDEL